MYALTPIHCSGIIMRNARKTSEITPIEATRVMGLIDSYRRTLELTEIENRLKVLEDEFAST